MIEVMEWDDSLLLTAREAWGKATTEEKSVALAAATAALNQEELFNYRGQKLTPNQPHAWPRQNAFYDSGLPIIGNPEVLKPACSRLATFLLAKIPLNVASLAHIHVILLPIINSTKLH